MTRDELIAALEAAPGPSMELDAHIWCDRYSNLGYRFIEMVGLDRFAYESPPSFPRCSHQFHRSERFTRSIDAAASLVKEGLSWRIHSHPMRSWATCGNLGEQDDAYGATPAIALCSAALKAMEGKDG